MLRGGGQTGGADADDPHERGGQISMFFMAEIDPSRHHLDQKRKECQEQLALLKNFLADEYRIN